MMKPPMPLSAGLQLFVSAGLERLLQYSRFNSTRWLVNADTLELVGDLNGCTMKSVVSMLEDRETLLADSDAFLPAYFSF